jgi:hypothetical protein
MTSIFLELDMPILITCVCGKNYKFKDENAGQKAKCPACGAVLVIEKKTTTNAIDELSDQLRDPKAIERLPEGIKSNFTDKQAAALKAQQLYHKVAWYRRSGTNQGFILFGCILFPPLLWTSCILALTGPIYYNRLKEDGQLKTWHWTNKVAAIILIIIQTIFTYMKFKHWVAEGF